jgi:thiol-disulfide isomerase/thioredoxin
MKILVAALSAALMVSGCINTSKANKPLVALKKAPEFSLKNVMGGELKSDDLKGKVVVVDFWATWCTPCIKEIPEYVKLREKFKGQNVEFVGVTFDSGTPEAVKPYIKDLGITYPVVMATDAVDAGFGGHFGYPTTFLVGKDWKIYRNWFNAPAEKIEQMERDITALLKKPVETPASEPTTAQTQD